MKRSVVIAVDIGTTSTKTMAIEHHGNIIISHAIEYPLHTPLPNRAEQDPDQIFQAVISSIREVVTAAKLAADEIVCVSFSSAMHSLIVVDEDNKPLSPSITFADSRSVEYVEKMSASGLGQQIYRATGTPIHPMSPLLKLMWMKDHDRSLFDRAYKFIGIKEYVFAKLFNQHVIDYSIASATGLFNLERLQWDELALQTAGISEARLSDPVTTTHYCRGMERTYANEMGLDPQTPFVLGASDGVLANLGIGAIEPGVYAVTIGTSGAVRGVVSKPQTDPEGRLFCYALNEHFWVVGGPINNGGIMLRWVRDQLATKETAEAIARGQDPYEYLTEIAGGVNPGSDGLLFLPLLTGERAPYWNANARGVFFGLSLFHEKKHMIRAVLEGVMFRIHAVLQALEEIAGETKQIKASGGFARSELWCQILADIAGTPLQVPEAIESSGLGAAKLGLLAMGEIKDLNELNDWVDTGQRYEVDARRHQIYEQLAPLFMRVYHQLKDEYDAIAAFQAEYAMTRQ